MGAAPAPPVVRDAAAPTVDSAAAPREGRDLAQRRSADALAEREKARIAGEPSARRMAPAPSLALGRAGAAGTGTVSRLSGCYAVVVQPATGEPLPSSLTLDSAAAPVAAASARVVRTAGGTVVRGLVWREVSATHVQLEWTGTAPRPTPVTARIVASGETVLSASGDADRQRVAVLRRTQCVTP